MTCVKARLCASFFRLKPPAGEAYSQNCHPVMRAGELLDTLPPGVDELVAISKVVAFLKAPEYAKFSRIIFDTAPTGHTLRLLTLPDFIDATIGKARACTEGSQTG